MSLHGSLRPLIDVCADHGHKRPCVVFCATYTPWSCFSRCYCELERSPRRSLRSSGSRWRLLLGGGLGGVGNTGIILKGACCTFTDTYCAAQSSARGLFLAFPRSNSYRAYSLECRASRVHVVHRPRAFRVPRVRSSKASSTHPRHVALIARLTRSRALRRICPQDATLRCSNARRCIAPAVSRHIYTAETP